MSIKPQFSKRKKKGKKKDSNWSNRVGFLKTLSDIVMQVIVHIQIAIFLLKLSYVLGQGDIPNLTSYIKKQKQKRNKQLTLCKRGNGGGGTETGISHAFYTEAFSNVLLSPTETHAPPDSIRVTLQLENPCRSTVTRYITLIEVGGATLNFQSTENQ